MSFVDVSIDMPDLFDEDVFERQILAGLDILLSKSTMDVGATIATWQADDVPTIARESPHKSGDTITAALRVVGEVWALVDGGSPPHGPIVAKRSKDGMLHYQANFTPKTSPRQIGSRAGGKSGPWIVRKSVPWHPGFEGREFADTIVNSHTDELEDIASNAVVEASK